MNIFKRHFRLKKVASGIRKKIYIFQTEPLDESPRLSLFFLGFFVSMIIVYLINFLYHVFLGDPFFKQVFDSIAFLPRFTYVYFIAGLSLKVFFRKERWQK